MIDCCTNRKKRTDRRRITINPADGVKDDADKDDDTKRPFPGKRTAVDVAILLDTSNSMDGLIGQAQLGHCASGSLKNTNGNK